MKRQVILCVDDESIVLKSLEMQLQKLFKNRFALEFAESGDEALELLHELHKDGEDVKLIISDWLMPGMKGDDFLIKAHKLFPKVRKTLLTGQANTNAMDRVKQLPGSVLLKPWTEKDIEALVKEATQPI